MLKGNTKIIIIILALLVIVVGIYLFNKKRTEETKPTTQQPDTQVENISNENTSLGIVSTNPSPLEGAVITPNQVIEINFNFSLYNEPETKIDMDPKHKYKIEIINSMKTLRIIPLEPYEFGRKYTLYINAETKFSNNQTLGKAEVFNFRTIDYKGI